MQIPYLQLRGSKVARFMGGSIGRRMEICEISALPIPMVPRLHQSNGYMKRKLWAWKSKLYRPSLCRNRTYHCVEAKYPVSWGYYNAQNGNMRNFGSTNPHGTAFEPKQWLYQKEATGIESSKMYCPSRCRYRTYHGVAAKYLVSRGVV